MFKKNIDYDKSVFRHEEHIFFEVDYYDQSMNRFVDIPSTHTHTQKTAFIC